jgi:Kdo2-lipid IVA lauroyltransferase/acyltransferase
MAKLHKQYPLKDRLRRIRHRVEFWGMCALAKRIPRMRRSRVLRLAKIVGRVGYFFDRRGRRLAEANLDAAIEHGGLDLKGRTVDSVIRDGYNSFARNFLDLFWFTGLTPEELWQWVEFDNCEPLIAARENRSGGIMLTSHFGSFEWSSLIVGHMGLHLKIVARDFRNSLLNSVFKDARECSGQQVYNRDRVALRLLRALRSGSHIAMLPDLAVQPDSVASPVVMFGIPSFLTAMPAELSLRFGAPIYTTICEPLDDGRVRLRTLKVLNADACDSGNEDHAVRTQRLTQEIWDSFEVEIQRRPECWLWMYKHWRHREAASDKLKEFTSVPDTAVRRAA